jgi:hypothetical protein
VICINLETAFELMLSGPNIENTNGFLLLFVFVFLFLFCDDSQEPPKPVKSGKGPKEGQDTAETEVTSGQAHCYS